MAEDDVNVDCSPATSTPETQGKRTYPIAFVADLGSAGRLSGPTAVDKDEFAAVLKKMYARDFAQLRDGQAEVLKQQTAEEEERLEQEFAARLARVRTECERGFEARLSEALRAAEEAVKTRLAQSREEWRTERPLVISTLRSRPSVV